MASEGRVAWWGGAHLPSTGVRGCGAKQGAEESRTAKAKRRPVCKRVREGEKRGLRVRDLAERGAKRRDFRIISLAAGGTQVGNGDLASASLWRRGRLRRALPGFAQERHS